MTPFSRRVGILGAGQLGRMLAMAGYPLGHKFGFYGLNHDEPAAMLGNMHIQSDDTDSLGQLVDFADVITYESENTSVELVEKISQTTPVYPSAASLYYSQHRGREKSLFTELNIPCAPYTLVTNLAELHQAVDMIGLPAILKSTTEGYDGKGQFVIKQTSQIEQAWSSIGEREAILEGFIEFKRELSIIAVRNADNQHVYYPLVENQHHEGILRLTVAPAQQISPAIQQQAETYMQALLDQMDHVGVLTLELFETEAGLVANEMAPRVHNSGHWTMEGAQTSQFENHIRAITGLPLGSTVPRQPFAAMVNIIGQHGDIEAVLKMPNAFLHLYDKAERAGRKLGHINVVADSEAELQTSLEQLKAWMP
ncbi:MAG: 5-(carboxyamino)imidazole ribonucleotide synthase [Thiomicrospira sp.]|uniref:5-(carboxyamino)imidazole ribonucleotide synthase n=1 Tax=Thiomicrospira sp. TaxID=935 RepID=UPI0019EF22C3|nr:5-(carboxyamino)imidazole ribonucleotide synthase [Thiomicrospira sp.]MBE0493082.1 5-(carboxyamino)imidazole ribonucleotide synthase [Thiomicrospira sp.]